MALPPTCRLRAVAWLGAMLICGQWVLGTHPYEHELRTAERDCDQCDLTPIPGGEPVRTRVPSPDLAARGPAARPAAAAVDIRSYGVRLPRAPPAPPS